MSESSPATDDPADRAARRADAAALLATRGTIQLTAGDDTERCDSLADVASMDSRLRGNDGMGEALTAPPRAVLFLEAC